MVASTTHAPSSQSPGQYRCADHRRRASTRNDDDLHPIGCEPLGIQAQRILPQPRAAVDGGTHADEKTRSRGGRRQGESRGGASPKGTEDTGMSRTYRDPNREPCRLAPLEAFSDELAENGLAARVQPHHQPRCGRESTTVSAVFASRCCGYREPPTAAELYDAMRRSDPTDRERTVLTAWVIGSRRAGLAARLDRASLQLADAGARDRHQRLPVLATHPKPEHGRARTHTGAA